MRDIYAQRGKMLKDVLGIRHYGKRATPGSAVIVAIDGMYNRVTSAIRNAARRSVRNMSVLRPIRGHAPRGMQVADVRRINNYGRWECAHQGKDNAPSVAISERAEKDIYRETCVSITSRRTEKIGTGGGIGTDFGQPRKKYGSIFLIKFERWNTFKHVSRKNR
jgi:hypothetical protein